MAPQIMRPEMDPHQGAGLFDHDPSGGIGDRKDSLVSFSPSGLEVILQPVGKLFGDEDYFSAFSALGIPDGQFLVIHIHGGKLQDFAHPHATPGHELQHEAVAHSGGPEYDLINYVFFVDLPLGQLARPEELFQHRGVTGILKLVLQVVADKIEESLEIGVAGVLGELLAGIIEAG